MRRGTWTLAGLALALSACAVTTGIVREQAARDLQCPEDQLAITAAGKGRYEVTGCSARSEYRCATSDLGSTDCVPLPETRALLPSMEAQRVRHKAAPLLACNPSALSVSETGKRRFTAEGCGRSIAYECLSRRDCCAFHVPGVQPLAVARAPGPELTGTPPVEGGSLPKRAIRAVISAGIGEVRACYEAGLTGARGAAGLVELKFIIGTEGLVIATAVARSSLDDASIASCIRDAVAKWRFPVPDGGGIVVVTYPFVLETTGPVSSCR
jgi:hypothetical protein